MIRNRLVLIFCLLASFLPALSGIAQTPAPAFGTVVVVNTLPGPGNLFVRFGPENIWPPGFSPGQSTGAVAFPAGKKAVEARCEGFVTTRLEAEIPAKANAAMVFYPGAEVKDGPDKGKRKIGLFQPEPHRAEIKGRNWKIILVGGPTSATLSVNGGTMPLQRDRPETIGEGAGNGVEVKNGGETIFTAGVSDPGEYWVVVYESEPGKLAAVLLNHLAYSVPSG